MSALPCNNVETATHSVQSHDYDWFTAKLDVDLPESAKNNFDGGTDSFCRGVLVRWKGSLGPDLDVLYYPEIPQVVWKGSPHKLAYGESVWGFDYRSVPDYVKRISGLLYLPTGVVEAAKLVRLDLGLNIRVDADVAEYVRAAMAPPRMKEIGSGPRSTSLKNSMAEILLYDKVEKVIGRKMGHVLPAEWAGQNWLRVEVRFKRPQKEFKRVVSLGDTATRSFYHRAVEKWEARVGKVRFVSGVRPFVVPPTQNKMVTDLAIAGVQAFGGPARMIERIEHARDSGAVPSHSARRQLEWLVRNVAGGAESPTASDFERKVREAVSHSLST